MQFTVDGTLLADNAVSVAGSTDVGSLLTLTPPTWSVAGVTTTYQWQRNGSNIAGQTGTSYTLTQADVGKNITVKATGTKAGYGSGTSTSDRVLVTAGPRRPRWSTHRSPGRAKVGQVLIADHGTWPGAPKYSYQWLRNGAVISDATSSSYRIRRRCCPDDLGAGDRDDGRLPGRGRRQQRRDDRQAAVDDLGRCWQAARSGRARHGKIKVTVTVAGVTKPTGKLQVFNGTKLLTTVTLKRRRLRPQDDQAARAHRGQAQDQGEVRRQHHDREVRVRVRRAQGDQVGGCVVLRPEVMDSMDEALAPSPVSPESVSSPDLVHVALRWLPAVLFGAVLLVVVRTVALPLDNTDTYFHLRFGSEFLHGTGRCGTPAR